MTIQSGKYVVLRVQNDHGAMTVRDPSRNSTFHVVECDDEAFEDVLDELDRADVVRLDIRRIGCRGNAWCVEDGARLEEGTDPVVDDPIAEEVGPVGESPPAGGDDDPVSEGEEADPVAGLRGRRGRSGGGLRGSRRDRHGDRDPGGGRDSRRRSGSTPSGSVCGSASTRWPEVTSGIGPVPARSTAIP